MTDGLRGEVDAVVRTSGAVVLRPCVIAVLVVVLFLRRWEI
jgi:hypothetical protein